MFLITRHLGHHKNKSNSLETRLWNDVSHGTLLPHSYGKIKRFDRERWNEIALGKLVFRLPFLFSLIIQKSYYKNNINTWHHEPHFIQNQKSTLQVLTLQMASPHLQDGIMISEKAYCNHPVPWNYFKVLGREWNCWVLEVKESLFAKRDRPSFNKNIYSQKLFLFYFYDVRCKILIAFTCCY